jgi:hypothetical protein
MQHVPSAQDPDRMRRAALPEWPGFAWPLSQALFDDSMHHLQLEVAIDFPDLSFTILP